MACIVICYKEYIFLLVFLIVWFLFVNLQLNIQKSGRDLKIKTKETNCIFY